MKDGGPAFPAHGSMGEVAYQGMTLRDYFAAKALQGLCASAASGRLEEFVKASWEAADAMLAERDK